MSTNDSAMIGKTSCTLASWRSVDAKRFLVAQTSVCVLFAEHRANQNHTG
jgi:hypothetical protein